MREKFPLGLASKAFERLKIVTRWKAYLDSLTLCGDSRLLKPLIAIAKSSGENKCQC